MPIFAVNVSFPMQPIMSPRQIPMRLPIKLRGKDSQIIIPQVNVKNKVQIKSTESLHL